MSNSAGKCGETELSVCSRPPHGARVGRAPCRGATQTRRGFPRNAASSEQVPCPVLVLELSGEEGGQRGTWGVDLGHLTPLGLSVLIRVWESSWLLLAGGALRRGGDADLGLLCWGPRAAQRVVREGLSKATLGDVHAAWSEDCVLHLPDPATGPGPWGCPQIPGTCSLGEPQAPGRPDALERNDIVKELVFSPQFLQ